jgi:hypothetical protein
MERFSTSRSGAFIAEAEGLTTEDTKSTEGRKLTDSHPENGFLRHFGRIKGFTGAAYESRGLDEKNEVISINSSPLCALCVLCG